jgi:hypothetical protein
MLGGFVLLAAAIGAWGYFGQKKKLHALEEKEDTDGVCAAPSVEPHPRRPAAEPAPSE